MISAKSNDMNHPNQSSARLSSYELEEDFDVGEILKQGQIPPPSPRQVHGISVSKTQLGSSQIDRTDSGSLL